MMRLNPTELSHQGNAWLVLRAEAYLASLHETSGDNLAATLANGMTLVAGLLCNSPDNAPVQERHRALAKLVLGKMQRIARSTDTARQAQAYPCFSS